MEKEITTYLTVCFIGLLFCSCFLPYLVAVIRSHRQRTAIGILNLLLGWTFLGWVAAIVWACTADTVERRPIRF